MCLITLAWRPGHAQPLVVAANRDEFYARPSAALSQWHDAPGIYAGRDLEAGGTWLGISGDGRFAALTNIRNMQLPAGRRSRGELPANFLRTSLSARDYIETLKVSAADYSGFNLLVGDGQQLCYFNSHSGQAQTLSAGVYGLSNAELDSAWPKVDYAKQALAQLLESPRPEAMLELLSDNQVPNDNALPDTGVGIATERLLGSAFIASQTYGTRASTALIVQADGHWQMVERSFGTLGVALGEVSLQG
ncbi:NRDE family protein [Pseudomonas segetis]|uniref:Uncharacterized conserved protein, contains NRDE domain n=1 Tax=Pseudomonas segetis TaxID=298908 RepID=A0A239IKV2_9PSED|nr:NRDE family protein [Pseudomonas segetis]SNS93034.1 Uncharacterized conserved protein, contains NRDE domain [Pseudomonas segetis]